MTKAVLFAFSICLLSTVFSKETTAQHSFPIEEKSLEKLFQEKLSALSEEEIEQKQREWASSLEKKVQNPSPVHGILETTSSRSFYFDPSIQIEEDIRDQDGRLIAGRGTVINPLKTTTLAEGLLIFDGTKPSHIEWAKTHQPHAFKWILIKGRPIELEEEEKRAVFFDQQGAICKKFDIQRVPCRVSQSGDRLLIEEVPVKGGL